MAEFKVMSVTSRNSVLKMLGVFGGATLKPLAKLGGVRSSHSIVSHGVSLNAMLTIPCTSGTTNDPLAIGERGVSIRSLLVRILSGWEW